MANRTGADFDHSAYLGDGNDGMYIDVKRRGRGAWGRAGWYVVASVESEHLDEYEARDTEDLPDNGPYATREEAARAAIDQALDWAYDNSIRVTKKEQKVAFKFLMTP